MKKQLSFYCIAFLSIGYIHAQRATIAIKITDEQHLNLPGATVSIDNNKLIAISDNTGTATLYNISEGSHQLLVRYIGYKDYTQDISVNKNASSLQITMASGVKVLDEVIVLGDRLKGQAKALNPQKKRDGGIEVFKTDTARAPMGIALYTRPSDGNIFAIVSRKSGPAQGYLQQYLLHDDGNGKVIGEFVRSFGAYSGKKEIESVAADNEPGFVYYSDEQTGIRKYCADPEKGNAELALFGQNQFKEDNEGISIYKLTDSTGYILVSDQSANRFNIYPREGNKHELIASVPASTDQSDGGDITSVSLPGFKGGCL